MITTTTIISKENKTYILTQDKIQKRKLAKEKFNKNVSKLINKQKLREINSIEYAKHCIKGDNK